MTAERVFLIGIILSLASATVDPWIAGQALAYVFLAYAAYRFGRWREWW
jgi:hypothetical protein